MYAQFFIDSRYQFDQNQVNFQKCIIGGNWLMLSALTITVICLTMSFGYENYLSIPQQVAAHITTIIFAAIFKLGYVLRCVGVDGLGYKEF